MRRIAAALVITSLVLGGMALPAEARGWHHRHHGHHHGHGHFFGGFLAGAATFLVLDALTAPRVDYPPVVYGPVYYRPPVCRNVWIPQRWEVRTRQQNGFTTYYHVLVPGAWQRQCYLP
ncbi:MAG: hypothetical protein ACE5MG_11820 [Candidatus Methylomirabilales bacterium]